MNKLVEIYTSIKEDATNTPTMSKENIECLNISNFIFSLLCLIFVSLFCFSILLFVCIPLCAIASIAGISNKFCNSKIVNENNTPFPTPNIAIADEIV